MITTHFRPSGRGASVAVYTVREQRKCPVYLNACIYVLTGVKGKTVFDEGSKKPSIADPV